MLKKFARKLITLRYIKKWNDKLGVVSCKLRVVSCYFKKINLRVASYFLQVAVLKE